MKCPYTLTNRQGVGAFLYAAKGETVRNSLKS